MTPPLIATLSVHHMPFGELAVLFASEYDAVIAAGFGDEDELIRRLESRTGRTVEIEMEASTGGISRQLDNYAIGKVAAINTIRVHQSGPSFRKQSWEAMRTISAGSPISYSRLAERAGRPTAIRAAASACASNLIALIVPCHRVVRSDGSVGNYLFGAEIKRGLLDFEAKNHR